MFFNSKLIGLFVVDDKNALSKEFLEYDTKTVEGNYYNLPDNKKLMVLLLLTDNHLWTTIRTWNFDKEFYYRTIIGKSLKIDIEEK